MEWCEELYREMSFEEFIRRGMRTIMVLVLFLAMVLGAGKVTSENALPGIQMGTAVQKTVGEKAMEKILEISEDAVNSLEREKKTDPLVVMPEEMIYEMSPVTVKRSNGNPVQTEMPGVLPEVSAAAPSVSVPNNDIPAPELSAGDHSAPDIPVTENNGFDAPLPDVSDVPTTENNGSDIPAMEEEGPDVPAADIPESGDEDLELPGTDNPVSDKGSTSEDNMDPDTEENTGADTVISGFIVDESGMICGISDMSLAVTDMCLYLPSEGCTGIAAGAFSSVTDEIVDVYIPSNITNIEEGAFLGLPYVCKYEVESGNSTYYAEKGVLFADGGACLLAFPAGRTGTYSVPAAVTRFAVDAFTGSILSKLDTRACALEDFGNLPESVNVQ